MTQPLALPDVTLVAIDCIAHDLTHEALRDTLREIEPAEVHVWSDQMLLRGAEHHSCNLNSLAEVGRTLWYEVPQYIKTSHFLLIQYDGWVLDSRLWRPEWLDCAYVGAPWFYPVNNVGNGGFSLRSTDLAHYVATHKEQIPFGEPEDDVLCRRYRGWLASVGFKWATQTSATQFSIERRPSLRKTFGFHGIFNWPHVMPKDKLIYRISLANDYVRSKSEWTEMFRIARPLLATA